MNREDKNSAFEKWYQEYIHSTKSSLVKKNVAYAAQADNASRWKDYGTKNAAKP